ncbi:MAG TPA: hypothetical protein VGL86_26040, partial [Polyangia bacterium]
ASVAAAAAADAEDPPAPPPEDVAPAKEPQTPVIPEPSPLLGGVTYEMPAVTAESAAPPVTQAETSGETMPPLASLSTLVVQKLSTSSEMTTPKSQAQPYLPARALEEPRVTMKTMKAATEPGWDGVATDATKSVRAPSRWLWILVGIALGVVAALVTVYFLRR